MNVRVGAIALFVSLMSMNQAVAGFFKITPAPQPPPPLPAPEIDGAGSIAVIALLGSIAAILINRYRNR